MATKKKIAKKAAKTAAAKITGTPAPPVARLPALATAGPPRPVAALGRAGQQGVMLLGEGGVRPAGLHEFGVGREARAAREVKRAGEVVKVAGKTGRAGVMLGEGGTVARVGLHEYALARAAREEIKKSAVETAKAARSVTEAAAREAEQAVQTYKAPKTPKVGPTITRGREAIGRFMTGETGKRMAKKGLEKGIVRGAPRILAGTALRAMRVAGPVGLAYGTALSAVDIGRAGAAAARGRKAYGELGRTIRGAEKYGVKTKRKGLLRGLVTGEPGLEVSYTTPTKAMPGAKAPGISFGKPKTPKTR